MAIYDHDAFAGPASTALISLAVLAIVFHLRRDNEYREQLREAADRSPFSAIPAQIDFHKRYVGVHLRIFALILPIWLFYYFALLGAAQLIFGATGAGQ